MVLGPDGWPVGLERTEGLTMRQCMALDDVVYSPATHCMLFGGARSGKTFLFVRSVLLRGWKEPNSTHAILRFRFNHLKASIIEDTLPTVWKKFWPDHKYTINRTDWFIDLPNGARVWFGGLDDKERTEKVLGQGHSTIYLNECSQISYGARNKCVTRLSQKNKLRLKAYYDCNPPPQGHWTYKVFIKGIEPTSGQPLPLFQQSYASTRINPVDNTENLPAETLAILQALPPKERKRFWDGEFIQAVDSALWDYDLISQRVLPDDAKLPELVKVVVAVDPSGCEGKEDYRSDEIGIVVAGLGVDGNAYVLEDASGRMGPAEWSRKACQMYRKWSADWIVAERNFGGAMVEHTIRTADGNVPYREVSASRGKTVRASPVSALYQETPNHPLGKVRHLTHMPELEDQMCAFSTSGYTGERSPDRADALVWALTDLLVPSDNSASIIDFMRSQVVLSQARKVEDDGLVRLRAPTNTSCVYGSTGMQYLVNSDGIVAVAAIDAPGLRGIGFIPIEEAH